MNASQLQDYYFWFSQPSSFLSPADRLFGYIFAAFLILAIVLFIGKKLTKTAIYQKLVQRFFSWSLFLGLAGLVWYGLRYESTYIFGRRYWAALVLVTGLVWLGFVLKYVAFNFKREKSIFEKESVRNKYLPR